MPPTNCPNCGREADAGLNFCGRCGAAMSNSVSTNAAGGPVKLIDSIGLTLRNAPIPDQLLSYSDCLTDESPDDEMMLGWAFKMRCYAQSGQFPDAQHARRKAREHYAAHLGLKADVLEQYLADTSYVEAEIGLTDATEHPWLYYLLHESTFPTSLYMLIGDTHEERAGHAMRAWASFGDDQTLLRKVLAVLQVRAKRYQVAVAIIEGILRSRFIRAQSSPPISIVAITGLTLSRASATRLLEIAEPQ
jgi:hypothetical protein